MSTQSNIRYSVNPIFSGGSPAQVPQETAERVALEERRAYNRYLSGAYGPVPMKRAHDRGLGGLAYSWREYKRGAKVTDLVTGLNHEFKLFTDFQQWSQQQRAWDMHHDYVRLTQHGANHRVLMGVTGMVLMVDQWGDRPGLCHVRDYRRFQGTNNFGRAYQIWTLGDGDWETLP